MLRFCPVSDAERIISQPSTAPVGEETQGHKGEYIMLTILLLATPNLIQMLIWLLIFLIVLSVVYWLINTLAPEPLKKYAIAIVVVIAVIMLLYFLMPYAGGGPKGP